MAELLALSNAMVRPPRTPVAGLAADDWLPPFILIDANGERLSSRDLLREEPAVLVVLPTVARSDGSALLQQLEHGYHALLRSTGITLVAIGSGDIVSLVRSSRRLGFSLPIAADTPGALGGRVAAGSIRVLIVEPDHRLSHVATGGPEELGRVRRVVMERLIDWAA